jgi:cytochrome c553
MAFEMALHACAQQAAPCCHALLHLNQFAYSTTLRRIKLRASRQSGNAPESECRVLLPIIVHFVSSHPPSMTLKPAMKKLIFAVSLLLAAGAQAQTVTGDAAAGKSKSFMCEGCHNVGGGYKASFPEVYYVPMLNGQSAGYIVEALKEYRSGARRNPTMKAIASSLTDQEMADIAAYYALPKSVSVK